MIYWQIFLAFFIPGVLGYGGGPASIPLIQYEVVERYGWMSIQQFSEVVAAGNSLPGPIATKMAGYIGFDVGGVLGAVVGVFATVAPSLILMILVGGLLFKYKDSPKVKRLTLFVQPVIAILLGVLTWGFFQESYLSMGIWHTLFLLAVSYFCIERWKIHPAFVIAGAMVYGGFLL